jgi:hypothetical protein
MKKIPHARACIDEAETVIDDHLRMARSVGKEAWCCAIRRHSVAFLGFLDLAAVLLGGPVIRAILRDRGNCRI